MSRIIDRIERESGILADGVPVPWTRKLLSNSKERMVSSGIGSERVCTAFDISHFLQHFGAWRCGPTAVLSVDAEGSLI